MTLSGLVIGYLSSASGPMANAHVCAAAGGIRMIPRPYGVVERQEPGAQNKYSRTSFGRDRIDNLSGILAQISSWPSPTLSRRSFYGQPDRSPAFAGSQTHHVRICMLGTFTRRWGHENYRLIGLFLQNIWRRSSVSQGTSSPPSQKKDMEKIALCPAIWRSNMKERIEFCKLCFNLPSYFLRSLVPSVSGVLGCLSSRIPLVMKTADPRHLVPVSWSDLTSAKDLCVHAVLWSERHLVLWKGELHLHVSQFSWNQCSCTVKAPISRLSSTPASDIAFQPLLPDTEALLHDGRIIASISTCEMLLMERDHLEILCLRELQEFPGGDHSCEENRGHNSAGYWVEFPFKCLISVSHAPVFSVPVATSALKGSSRWLKHTALFRSLAAHLRWGERVGGFCHWWRRVAINSCRHPWLSSR